VGLLGKRGTDELARPVQTLIWYPAEKSANSPVLFGDYLGLSVRELEPTADKGSVEFLALLKKRYGDLMNEKTWAEGPSSRRRFWHTRYALPEHLVRST
jgi:hypothetical protein